MFGVVWWYSNSQVVLAMNMILKTVVVGRLMENTYIVASEDTKECVIIDPGDEGARILYEVNGLGLKVKLILNTHGHSDHTGAVEFIRDATGAKYGIHQGDVHMLRSSVLKIHSGSDPVLGPDRLVEDGDILDLGGIDLNVITTPGHTQGSVCYYIKTMGVVFTGDTLFNGSIGRSDMSGGNSRQLMHGIMNRLMSLPVDTKVYPGHGPDSTIGHEKLTNPFVLRWSE